MAIPQPERDDFIRSVRSHPEYLDPALLIDRYRDCGLRVDPDPFSTEIIERIERALSAGQPYCVVRIGDGEANLLSYGAYPETPSLNRHVLERFIAMQQDRFKAGSLWRVLLRDLMMGALREADVVGVIGLWRYRRPEVEEVVRLFAEDPRGTSGHWRAMEYMLRLADEGLFRNRTVASAHLYFSLVENLHRLVGCTDTVFVISNRKRVTEKLSREYPGVHFEPLLIGAPTTGPLPDEPGFLLSVHERLPAEMSRSLSLVGAGPWAEIYCAWIKQRGGVAVDIGSGLDLLDGEATRPIHERLGRDRVRGYAL